jgi:hypothetical protein
MILEVIGSLTNYFLFLTIRAIKGEARRRIAITFELLSQLSYAFLLQYIRV